MEAAMDGDTAREQVVNARTDANTSGLRLKCVWMPTQKDYDQKRRKSMISTLTQLDSLYAKIVTI